MNNVHAAIQNLFANLTAIRRGILMVSWPGTPPISKGLSKSTRPYSAASSRMWRELNLIETWPQGVSNSGRSGMGQQIMHAFRVKAKYIEEWSPSHLFPCS